MDKNKFIKTAKGIGVGSLIAAMIVMNGCVKEYSLPVGKDGEETIVMTNEKGPMREWLSNKKVNGLSISKNSELKKILNDKTLRKGLDTEGLPLKFLKEMELIETYDRYDVDILIATNNPPYGGLNAFSYANEKDNTITTILTAYTGKCTNAYKLTYNVTEDDIKTFKYLDGDPRLNFFIQGLDEVYERKVELKSVASSGLYSKFYFETKRVIDQNSVRSAYYIDEFNFEEGTVKYIYQTPEGLRCLTAQLKLPIDPKDCIETEEGLCFSPSAAISSFITGYSEDRPIVIPNDGEYYIPDYIKKVNLDPEASIDIKEGFNDKIFK